MKKVLAFCMVVLALVACMAPAGMERSTTVATGNKFDGIEVCSDMRPHPYPYD